MLLVPDTVAAAEHAAAAGFIGADAVALVRAEKRKDESAPTIAEQMPVMGTVAETAASDALPPEE
jgi:hypothetical protein